jgi:tRNA-Thr(GGU) m(6)t(6)A37 methyltransferase TsaA
MAATLTDVEGSFVTKPVGYIRSPLANCGDAPLQGDEGGHPAWVEIDPLVAAALQGLKPGDDILILSWLHEARRDTLQVHPRGRKDLPLTGVFATRSPSRPNPIGLHRVSIRTIEGTRINVAPLEAIDGTPVLDIKPVLMNVNER